MTKWRPIAEAIRDVRVTGEQRTLFVAQFRKEAYPSFNCVYYDHLHAGDTHPWVFADGSEAYHRDWPTHWMLAEDAAPAPDGCLTESSAYGERVTQEGK
jgi:hypothetical protein